MYEIMMRNKVIADEALRGLENGYNQDDFMVLSQAITNMYNISEIKEYEQEHGKAIIESENKIDITEDIPQSIIDDKMRTMLEAYNRYVNAKKDYQENNSDSNKILMLNILDRIMDIHSEIVEELWSCTDCEEERNHIKLKTRNMYTNMS